MGRPFAREREPSYLAELERLVRRQERPRGFERLLMRTQTLLQSAVRAVLSSERGYREEGRRTGWLRRIVRNVKRTKLRRARDASGRIRQVPTPDLDPPCRDDDPVRGAERGELRTAVGDLPPEERDVVRLLFLQGGKPGETASRLGVSVKTVRRRRLAALERLREKLGGSEES